MKINAPREKLEAALNVVRHAAQGKSTIPNLAHVAICTKASGVEFRATDLDLTIRTTIECTVIEQGDTTVNAKLLHDLVRTFTDETVRLTQLKSGLKVEADRNDSKLPTLAIEDFPSVPVVKGGKEFRMTVGALRKALSSTAFASSTDQSRYILNGSLLDLNGSITCVATDGRRLALTEEELESGQKKTSVILPVRTVNILLTLLTGKDEDRVTFTVGESLVRVEFGDTTVLTKLIEGNYPNYQQVIPDTDKMDGVNISRTGLLVALQRIALLGENCTLEFDKQSLSVKSSDAKFGEAEDTLLIPKCKRLTMSFRVKYLVDALTVADAEEIRFFAEDGQSPGVIRIPGKPWLCVIMPLRLTEKLEKADAKAAEEAAKKAEQAAPQTEAEAKA